MGVAPLPATAADARLDAAEGDIDTLETAQTGLITEVTTAAGSGLTGGATSGAVALAIDPTDTGVFTTTGVANRVVATNVNGGITATHMLYGIGVTRSTAGSFSVGTTTQTSMTVGRSGASTTVDGSGVTVTAATGALSLSSSQAMKRTVTGADAQDELWNTAGAARVHIFAASKVPTGNAYDTVDGYSLPDNSVVCFSGHFTARSGSNVRVWKVDVVASRVSGTSTVKLATISDLYVADSVQGTGAASALVAGDLRASMIGATCSFDIRNAQGLTVGLRLTAQIVT